MQENYQILLNLRKTSQIMHNTKGFEINPTNTVILILGMLHAAMASTLENVIYDAQYGKNNNAK